MYDRRYPAMFPVDGRSLPGLSSCDAKAAKRLGDAISTRTGTRCYYNARSGKLLFCYDAEPHGGPLLIPFKNPDGTIKDHRGSIDDMVHYINFGKMSRAEKDRIERNNEAAVEAEKVQAQGRFSEGNRKNALDYAAFKSRRRRGVAKTIVA